MGCVLKSEGVTGAKARTLANFPNKHICVTSTVQHPAAQLTPKFSQFSADPLTPLSLGLFFVELFGFLFCFVLPSCMHRILVPWTEIEPAPLAVKLESSPLNYQRIPTIISDPPS